VYDRRRPGYDPLQRLLELFADAPAATVTREDRRDWPVERRLRRRIVDGDREGLVDDLEEALAHHDALAIINDVLLPGMKTVGDLFAAGEMQLPFVLQSAETMKAAVGHLEPHLARTARTRKGTIVLCPPSRATSTTSVRTSWTSS